MASDDDTAYKQLFAHPEMVRDLLLGFVPGTWVGQLDLASFERVSGKRITYAEMDDLDRWFDRLFDAKSVRQVFADKQPA